MRRRSVLAAIGLVWGACAHAPPPAEKPPLAFAVLGLGDREAEKGCVMTLLGRGFRVIQREAIDAALENADTSNYKRLGAAVHADFIVDVDRLTRDKHHQQPQLSALLVSVASGDMLAMTPLPPAQKTPFAMGQAICSDLIQQLP